MVALILLIPLVVAQQYCSCYNDDSRGHWTDASCSSCGFAADGTPYSGPQCKNLPLRVNWPSASYSCNDLNVNDICNNAGTCQNRTSCLCNPGSNRAGTYCEKCAPGWGGYPACLTPACNATSCSGNGACQDALPCGTTFCDPTRANCQVDTDSIGRRSYTCRDLTYSPCGTNGAAARHIDADPGFAPTSVGCAPSALYVYNVAPSVTGLVSWKCVGTANGQAACCAAETTACRGKTNTAPPNNELLACCRKSQTCCYGRCCGNNQVCKALPTPPGGWKFNAEYTCVSQYLTNMSAVRVVVVPLFLLIAIVIATALVFRVGAPASFTVPGGILVFLVIFVLFSPLWGYALLILSGVYFAIGSSKAKSPNRYLYAFAYLVIILAILLGGLNLGSLWLTNGATFFPSLGGPAYNPAAPLDSKQPLATFQLQCASYYNYFHEDALLLRPYGADTSTGQSYWGYCDQRWLAALQFFFVCIVVVQLILIATVAYSYGNDEAPSRPAGKEMGGTNNDQL